MFTAQALLKAKIDLYNISANMARQDYLQANYRNGKRISKKHIPYSLSQETETAQEYYKMVYGKQPEEITAEQEEDIKAYLLMFRCYRTEYLKENGGTDYYKNSLKELEV
jgi:hypothetical protein